VYNIINIIIINEIVFDKKLINWILRVEFLFNGNDNKINGSNVLNTKLSIRLFNELPNVTPNPIKRIILYVFISIFSLELIL
jgi:hypothetical protein